MGSTAVPGQQTPAHQPLATPPCGPPHLLAELQQRLHQQLQHAAAAQHRGAVDERVAHSHPAPRCGGMRQVGGGRSSRQPDTKCYNNRSASACVKTCPSEHPPHLARLKSWRSSRCHASKLSWKRTCACEEGRRCMAGITGGAPGNGKQSRTQQALRGAQRTASATPCCRAPGRGSGPRAARSRV